jgi:hypothetical protein
MIPPVWIPRMIPESLLMKLLGMMNDDWRLTNGGCRFALLLLTNKIARIP